MSRVTSGRGFRWRLTLTVIGLVVATALVVSVTSYLLVRGSLREQLVADAVGVTEFAVVELATTEQLPEGADRRVFEASGLAERFTRRGVAGVYVDFGDGDPYASRAELLATPSLVSPQVDAVIDAGEFGYQFVEVAGEARLMVAARRPSGEPRFHLFFDATAVEQALGDLWRFLSVGTAGVALAAVFTAGAVAKRVLRPVASAGEAARSLSRGDLDTRVPVSSTDEFGTMAEAFNTMAESLQHQIVALEEAEARERRFVADVSHELRTPLTGLSNAAQLLAPDIGQLSGPARRAAELLVDDVERFRRLIDELLEISRLESGSAPVGLVETDVERFLSALISARSSGARLEVDAPQPVLCERHGLERVVTNLLDNAAAHAPGAPVDVSAVVSEGTLQIGVCDRGPGVPAEALPRLFDRFYKADPSRQGGSGLGLAIARQHAVRMGGDLTAAPRDGGGLCFSLLVPVTVSLHDGDGAENPVTDDEGDTRRQT